MEKDMHNSNNYGRKNHKGTFIVKLDDCQRETWQGKVVWAEENVTEHFRSALELIKLIDEAVNASDMSSQQDADESAC